jgi:biotin carboxyl carrier protein
MKKLNVTVNGISYEVEVELIEEDNAPVSSSVVSSERPSFKPAAAPPQYSKPVPQGNGGKEGILISPMNGKIMAIKVNVGENVKNGQVVLELEAMKMKTNIYAKSDGKVKSVFVNTGDLIESGQKLIEFE